MHVQHTLLFAFATLCTSAAIKEKFCIDFVISQFPTCTQACSRAALATNPLRDDDLFGFCNNPALGRATGACVSQNCTDVDFQKNTAIAAIYCAPIGGGFQERFGPPASGGSACINNCTSSAVGVSSLVTRCEVGDKSCTCKDPNFASPLGACISQRCSAEEIAENNAKLEADCAPFGGVGPYDINRVQGYLHYGLPEFLPPLRIINSTVLATPTGTRLPLRPTPPPRKRYGKKKGGKGSKGSGNSRRD